MDTKTAIGSAVTSALLSPLLTGVLLAVWFALRHPQTDKAAPALLLVAATLLAFKWVSPVALVFGAMTSRYLVRRVSRQTRRALIIKAALVGGAIGGACGVIFQTFASNEFAEIRRTFSLVGLVVGLAAGCAVALNVVADHKLLNQLSILSNKARSNSP